MTALLGRARRKVRRGSALLATMVIVILLTGISVAFSSYIFSYMRRSEALQVPVLEAYGAEAAIEKVWYEISHSNYTGGNNDWLLANSSAGGMTPAGYANMPFGPSTATVRVYDLGTADKRYLAVAYARHNTNTNPVNAPTIIAQEFQSNVSFGNYAFFVSQEDLHFGGGADVNGSVQSNRRVRLWDAQQKTFQKDLKTSLGLVFNAPASWANTTVLGTVVSNAPPLGLPATSVINDMRNFSDGDPYYVHTANGVNDTYITPMGDDVRVVVKNRVTGTVVYDQVLPPPSEGVIFVQGNCFIEPGVQSSRWTLACMNKVTINGSVTYQDAGGDDAYILKDTTTGLPIPKASWPTTAWTNPPLSYEQNPAYNPDPNNPPILGIVAQGDVEIAQTVPANFEGHFAVLSTTGTMKFDLAGGAVKGNFRLVGGVSSKLAPYTTNGVAGFVGSRGYIYDPNLTVFGPPQYPAANQAGMGVRWKVPPHEAAQIGLTPWP